MHTYGDKEVHHPAKPISIIYLWKCLIYLRMIDGVQMRMSWLYYSTVKGMKARRDARGLGSSHEMDGWLDGSHTPVWRHVHILLYDRWHEIRVTVTGKSAFTDDERLTSNGVSKTPDFLPQRASIPNRIQHEKLPWRVRVHHRQLDEGFSRFYYCSRVCITTVCVIQLNLYMLSQLIPAVDVSLLNIRNIVILPTRTSLLQ